MKPINFGSAFCIHLATSLAGLTPFLCRAVVCAIPLVAAFSARAAIVDDFTSDTLSSEWVVSETLRQTGPVATAVITYDTTTNDNTLTYSFATPNTRAVQTTVLRDDVTLGVGQYMQTLVNLNPSGGITAGPQLFGGLVFDRLSETPANDLTVVGMVLDLAGNGTIQVQIDGLFQSPATATVIGDHTDVYLRMTRLAPHAFQGSYSTDGINFTPVGRPVTATGVAAVGLFNGNARSTQSGTVQFDDFEISAPQFPVTPLLNVDFDSSTAHASGVGPTQPTDSFVGFNSSTPVPGLSQSFGGITVSINDNTGRDRPPATLSGTYADLYRDFSLATELTLSGLVPNAGFVITFQAYDDAVNSAIVTTYTDTTVGGLTNGVFNSVTWNGTTNPGASLGTSNAATSLYVRSNSLGELRFSIGGGDNRLNGFQLYMVPEPGAFCMLAWGGVVLVCRRRRTTSQF